MSTHSQTVVTYTSPEGAKLSICTHCEDRLLGMGSWPKDARGQEYCQVSHGRHFGRCGLYAEGRDVYAAVRDNQIVAWTTAEDDAEAQLWHRGYCGTSLVVLDLAADEKPMVGAYVVVDEDGVAELDW